MRLIIYMFGICTYQLLPHKKSSIQPPWFHPGWVRKSGAKKLYFIQGLEFGRDKKKQTTFQHSMWGEIYYTYL